MIKKLILFFLVYSNFSFSSEVVKNAEMKHEETSENAEATLLISCLQEALKTMSKEEIIKYLRDSKSNIWVNNNKAFSIAEKLANKDILVILNKVNCEIR